MADVKYKFKYWNLPSFHSKMIKPIVDEAMMKLANDDSLDKFMYADVDMRNIGFCDGLATVLSDEYEDTISSSSLFVTYGSTYGFAYLLDSFFHAGDTVVFEEITHGPAREYAINRHMDVKAVPFDGVDLSLPHLEDIMKKTKPKKNSNKHPYNGMLYLLPILHNPRGTCYSEECSIAVVKLARKYNFLVVTDDVYNFYQFTEKKKRRLFYYDKILEGSTNPLGNVVSNGTLSKIIFPSIRLGWIEAKEEMVNQFIVCPQTLCGGGFNFFNQRIAEKILKHEDMKNYLKELKEVYKSLMVQSCEYFKKNLPNNVTFRVPDGSSFIWVELPKNCTAEEVQEECMKRDTVICVGREYGGEKYANFFRIPVTNEHREEAFPLICEAVRCVVGK